jgi:hypothetical protein
MKSLETTQKQATLAQLDSNKQLCSSTTNEVAQAVTLLNSIRNNNSTSDQIIVAASFIKNEYPKLTLGELQQIILDGIMQKFNNTEQPQYNDMPSLMYWLKKNNAKNVSIFPR